MKRIIFHLPFKVLKEYPSASQLRPLKMLQAFKDIGYEVDLVSGYGKERKKMIQKVKENVKNGIDYAFLYSESYNMPNLLSEPSHLPKFPFLDSGFLAFCKKSNIPIGLFYRDVHWNFPHYRQNFGLKTLLITYPFYMLDLYVYRKYVDVLYAPTVEMMDYVPVRMKGRIEALPPGIERDDISHVAPSRPVKGKVKVLYVGGIGNLYQIDELVRAVGNVEASELTICCREPEWKAVEKRYEALLNNRISVVHKKGNELKELYDWADITSIFVKPIEYWKIVMPMKLFEYMLHHKPMVGVEQTAVGNFIADNGLGWSLPYEYGALEKLLGRIVNQQEDIQGKVEMIHKILPEHTWIKRAEKVKLDLDRSPE